MDSVSLLLGIAIGMTIFTILSFIFNIIKQNSGAKNVEIAESGAKPPVTSRNLNNTEQLPLEIVAAITAAISAQTGLSTDKFIVRSISRVNSWNESTKREQQRRIF